MLELIPLPVRIGALVAVIVGASVAGWTVRGTMADRDMARITENIAAQREQAATQARATERAQQENVNEALRAQSKALADINRRLAHDIDRLRQRPERPAGVPEAARPACEGANGAELGGGHAIFLARFAALAARYDAALATCYQTLDGVRP